MEPVHGPADFLLLNISFSTIPVYNLLPIIYANFYSIILILFVSYMFPWSCSDYIKFYHIYEEYIPQLH